MHTLNTMCSHLSSAVCHSTPYAYGSIPPVMGMHKSMELVFDILPALKGGDSHNWRHMSVPGKDI